MAGSSAGSKAGPPEQKRAFVWKWHGVCSVGGWTLLRTEDLVNLESILHISLGDLIASLYDGFMAAYHDETLAAIGSAALLTELFGGYPVASEL